MNASHWFDRLWQIDGSAAWLDGMWRASWQGAIAIGLAWTIAHYCRFLSPRVVCWVWRAACLKMLVALVWAEPLLLAVLPAEQNLAPARSVAVNASSPVRPIGNPATQPVVERASPIAAIAPGTLLFAVWLAGPSLIGVTTLRQWIHIRRLVRQSAACTTSTISQLFLEEARALDISRVPGLRISHEIHGPFLAGIWQPTIVLPADAEAMFSAAELRGLLAHELAHQKRRDLAWNLLPMLVQCWFYFHPFAWLMGRGWGLAQESACDELVLQTRRTSSADYARLLVKCAGEQRDLPRASLAAAGVLGNYRNLERRIMATARIQLPSTLRLCVAAVLLALIAIPATIPWRLVAEEQPAPTKQQQASPEPAETREVRGRVLDEQGRPAANIDVCAYWGANGPFWDENGKQVDFSDEAASKEYFGPARLGRMDPGLKETARTDASGEFHIQVPDYLHALLVMDAQRVRGGLGAIPKDANTTPVEIRLAPMTRVRASFEGPDAGEKPSWTHAYIETPYETTRPLDLKRLVGCSSDEAKLLVSLPPGRYFIDAYNRGVTAPTASLSHKEFVIPPGQKELDLGVLRLPATKDFARRQQSRAAGRWGDYTKHYGRKPPAWFANEARGVSKDASIADFKGRWVLIEFWNMNCGPCLKRSLPEAMKFYEEHSGERGKLEILSMFLDPDEEYASLAAVDRALERIVERVWGGKTIKFPMLLDSSYRTWESFGLPAMGTIVLIDPQGNLVPGGLPELAEQLEK